jgi:deoxycytidylate deaminase
MLVTPKRVIDFEIVIGFVAPIGTDLGLVTTHLAESLSAYAYSSEIVQLSTLIPVRGDDIATHGRLRAAMDAGDALRERFRSADIVAAKAIVEMARRRSSAGRDRRHAFILRTLKHEDEVALLRQTYGPRFVLVSVFDDENSRTEHLANTLKDESPGAKHVSSQVATLIERDDLDADNRYGQHVRDTFTKADYFLSLTQDVAVEVARLVDLLFGFPFVTPSRDEVAMFQAFGASLRSADPGRQVGAVISNHEGQVIAVGSNEVPKAGGGEYWAGDDNDDRDFRRGYDFNKRQSHRAIKEFIEALAGDGLLSEPLLAMTANERFSEIVDEKRTSIKQSRLLALIEFGRVVHAEMSAITHAARNGTAIANSVLYTTAFPCHMCMRLIIASGITRVVYVDPYPKSLAFEMYFDSVEAGNGNDKKVATEPYRGTSLRIYADVFKAINRERTSDGTFKSVEKTKMRMRLPGVEPLLNAEFLEDQVIYALSEAEARLEDIIDGTEETK